MGCCSASREQERGGVDFERLLLVLFDNAVATDGGVRSDESARIATWTSQASKRLACRR
jgi:hypothetical protein